jgi:hypothetical protein
MSTTPFLLLVTMQLVDTILLKTVGVKIGVSMDISISKWESTCVDSLIVLLTHFSLITIIIKLDCFDK